jgi:hypothetical protein
MLWISGGIAFVLRAYAVSQGPSSQDDFDVGTQQLVWGTSICVGDVERAVDRFLKEYKEDPNDLEAKYMRYLEQVFDTPFLLYLLYIEYGMSNYG